MECLASRCRNPATHKATLTVGAKAGKVTYHCGEHIPGARRPKDATWPMCYDVTEIDREATDG